MYCVAISDAIGQWVCQYDLAMADAHVHVACQIVNLVGRIP